MADLIRAYVAGPLTGSGSLPSNVRRAIDAAERLRRGGLIPFVPHLFATTWEVAYPDLDYEDWMALDLAWLDVCDVLVRLAGPSKGADREERRARELGIPIFYEGDFGADGRVLVEHAFAPMQASSALGAAGMQRGISALISKVAMGEIEKRRTLGSIGQIQREMPSWQAHNFPGRPKYWPLLGMVEELGELAHAFAKRAQGVRGTAEEHTAAIEDAIVDLFTFGVDFACAEHIDLEVALPKVWAKVRERDWRAFPRYGVPPAAAIAQLEAKRAELDREIAELQARARDAASIAAAAAMLDEQREQPVTLGVVPWRNPNTIDDELQRSEGEG
jgi:NTP pyrophosphatase (non-canonical NTP hydrolase)